jgi:hypothetical protein
MNHFHQKKRTPAQIPKLLSFPGRRLTFRLGLLVAAVPVLAWSQIALVHVTTCGEQIFPSTCTIPATKGGNLIVVGFETDVSNTTTTISGITDNAGNVYAEAGAARAVDASLLTVTDLWYAKNSVAGAKTITINPSASINAVAVIWEFAGIDTTSPLDQTAVLNSQPGTTAVSGAPVTTTSGSEVIISIADVSNTVTGIASGNAFTDDSTAFASGWAHLIASTPGTYAAQWNQTPAGTYDSSTVSFKAAGGPAFTLSVSPSSQAVTAGGSSAYTMSVAPTGGFTGTVTLSASGQPSGGTATFNPSSITTSGSSTLTVSTISSTPAASYPLNVTGASGSLTQTVAVTLVVTTSSGSSACDLNKDGAINVIDVQLAVNTYLACTAEPNVSSQAFSTQVINGALGGSCSATTGIHTVFLNWATSPTSGVTYNVYRSTTSGSYTTPLNSAGLTGTVFADCSVAPGQTYYYVVRAVDGSGNQSPNSPEASVAVPSS